MRIIWMILGALYSPIYIAAVILHAVLRFLLAITHFLMLNRRMSSDIIKNLFNYGRGKGTVR